MADSNDVTAYAIAEPRDDMEFESHESAYSFYKEYARSAGFGTAKLSSRRSRASKEFIDAKFSCIRYGNKQQSDDAINPRPSPKIGCKASMHVKKGKNGKWFVHSFMKDHNHELLPAQAHFFRSHRDADSLKSDRMRKRKNLSSGSKILNAYQSFDCLETYLRNPHDKGRSLVLEAGDAQMLLELFMHIQEDNPKFFYAVDLNEEHRLRNVFWVDAKGIEDYSKFGDVVSFDTTYFTNKYKIPLVLFIGVNHHIQPTLFGCALIADDTIYTLGWLMQTWFAAMGERAPQVILSDQNHALKVAVADVFPETRHCFSLWLILDKIHRQLEYLNLCQDTFMAKFKKCIFRSPTVSEFERRWWKLLDRFNLRDVKWVQFLYQDRMQWVPTFIRDISFAGLSTLSRAESLNTWFDKYVTLETSVREFIDKYRVVLEDRYEEEAKADFDSWHETPELKSPSPFEKQMSLVYTHEIFKKFQVEVLGAAACHLKKESEDTRTTIYSVKDFADVLNYVVEWNESKSSIYCSCHLFEFKGYLCRHTIIVLQMSGFFSIPPRYVLQRWTNTCRHSVGEKLDEVQLKVRRYNDLCRRAIILGEEGSLSHESYEVALHAINEVLKECASASNLVENEQQQRILSSNLSVSEPEEGDQFCERTRDQTSDAGPSSRSKVPWRTNLGKGKVANENYTAKTGKLPKSDCLRVGALDDLHSEEFIEGRSANAHTVPTVYHHVMPPPFQGMTAMQLQQSHLPR